MPDDVAEVIVDLIAHPVAQPAEPRRDPAGAAAAESADAMSAFDKHRDELEKHETMMGPSRGRLAVALDLLTDALAMVGQHGVYCQSARIPASRRWTSRSCSSRSATPRSWCRASSSPSAP